MELEEKASGSSTPASRAAHVKRCSNGSAKAPVFFVPLRNKTATISPPSLCFIQPVKGRKTGTGRAKKNWLSHDNQSFLTLII